MLRGYRATAFIITTWVLTAATAGGESLRVTTADGQGADTAISSAADATSSGRLPELPLLFQQRGGASQKVYLRFDLSKIAGKHCVGAMLVLQPVSGGSNHWDANVFGLRELTIASPAAVLDGAEVRRDEVAAGAKGGLAWADAPGHDPKSGGGYVDLASASSFPGARAEAVEFLGRIGPGPDGGRVTLSDQALADHLNADLDGFVTLLITRADRGAAPIAVASKEHPAFDPPTLLLGVLPEPRDSTAQRLLAQPIRSAGGARPLDAVWAAIEYKARKQKSWKAVLPEVDAVVRAVAGAGPRSEDAQAAPSTPTQDLVRLLRLEAALRAGEINGAEWARSGPAIFKGRAPAEGAALFRAFWSLAGWRTSDAGSFVAAPIDLTPWIDAGVPDEVRFAIGRTREYGSVRVGNDARAVLGFYGPRLAPADGYLPDPYVVARYADGLTALVGRDAAATFLDEVAARYAGRRAGTAAGLLKIQGEPDARIKSNMVVRAVERDPSSLLAAAVRRRYLAIKAERGEAIAAVTLLDPDGAEFSGATPLERAERARALVVAVPQFGAFDSSEAGESPVYDLGEEATEFSFLSAVAEEDWAGERHAEATEAAFEALRSRGVRLTNLMSAEVATTLTGMGLPTRDADAKAVAALMLGMCAVEAGRQDDAKPYLEVASAGAPGPVRAYVAFVQAKGRAEAAGVAAAAEHAKAALELAPESPVLRVLSATADAAATQDDAFTKSAAAVEADLTAATAEADPARAQAAYLRAGDGAAALGHTEKAVAIYDKLLERYPAGERAKDALTRCVELLGTGTAPGEQARAAKYRRALEQRGLKAGGAGAATSTTPKPQ